LLTQMNQLMAPATKLTKTESGWVKCSSGIKNNKAGRVTLKTKREPFGKFIVITSA